MGTENLKFVLTIRDGDETRTLESSPSDSKADDLREETRAALEGELPGVRIARFDDTIEPWGYKARYR